MRSPVPRLLGREHRAACLEFDRPLREIDEHRDARLGDFQRLFFPGERHAGQESIPIHTVSGDPAMAWQPSHDPTDCGQETVAVSNLTTDGYVDLRYRQ
jgi:hypothetical protein